jgi:transcriptional regulator with XRE-family HTH domain
MQGSASVAEEHPARLNPDIAIIRRIKEHRTARGLSQNQLAHLIGYPQSCVSQIETGKRRLTDGIAEALDKHLSTHGEFTLLLEMSRALLIEPGAREVLSREPEAARIRVFASSSVPGLLQTEDYARALIRRGLPRDSASDVSERAAERMRRQARVFDQADPPFYRAVVDEAVLARPVGSKAVMAAQLQKLVSLRENQLKKVQVVPFETFEHGLQGGSLYLLDLRGGTLAMLENFRTAQGVESPREVAEYQELFDAADWQALSVDESAELIDRYRKEYENG